MAEMVRAGAWKGLDELITQLGGNPAQVIASAGLTEHDLINPNAYLPLKSLLDTLEYAATSTGRDDFGLITGKNSAAHVGALALAVLNAPTAREGILFATDYIHIHNHSIRASLTRHSPSTEFLNIQWANGRHELSVQMTERITSGAFHIAQAVVGPDLQAVAIHLTTPRNSAPHVYKSMFGLDPVFDSDHCGIEIPSDQLDRIKAGTDPHMLQIAEAHLMTMGPPQGECFIDQVELLIRGFLAGNRCTIEQIASSLNMHSRTLQRRLRDEGTSFEALKDITKRRRAEKLLSQKEVSLTDIAFLLGYSESSTFSRKAREWFGVSPREFRKRLTG